MINMENLKQKPDTDPKAKILTALFGKLMNFKKMETKQFDTIVDSNNLYDSGIGKTGSDRNGIIGSDWIAYLKLNFPRIRSDPI